MPVNADIHPHQAQGLIRKLIRFCGRENIDKGIASYKKGVQCNGEIYNIYFKNRHPWWRLIIEFDSIVATGQSFNKHILDSNGELKHEWRPILADAKKISEMYSLMTEDVRKFYKSTLVDDNNARSHLYELNIAWHYLIKEHEVSWVQSGGKKPEFVVSKDGFSFCIECKRISLGSYTNVRHEDFYRFCDNLLPKITEMGLMGKVDVSLNGKLPSQISMQQEIVEEILNEIGEGNGSFDCDFGNVSYELVQSDGVQVDVEELKTNVNGAKAHNTSAIVYTDSSDDFPKNPVTLLCTSRLSSQFVQKMFNLVKKAAKEQLDKTMPGFVSVYM